MYSEMIVGYRPNQHGDYICTKRLSTLYVDLPAKYLLLTSLVVVLNASGKDRVYKKAHTPNAKRGGWVFTVRLASDIPRR